ncbi:DEAD/DEAH box helicase family protein [Dehalobacter sp. DCM]|uniref:DEAD/DEAH box helicase family protein n=1 Tax=Dehalobacter sp. DCM TaxID=2907827 RepID=UPI003081615B|nr:DEAD/DEAH box helicase family protein [Dehalobacter sp. DCM]
MMNAKAEFGFSPVPAVDRLVGDWERYINLGLPLNCLNKAIISEPAYFLWPGKQKRKDPGERALRNIISLIERDEINIRVGKELPSWKDIREADIWKKCDCNRNGEQTHGYEDDSQENFIRHIQKNDSLFQSFLRFVEGRQLAENEIVLLGNELGIKEEDVVALMQFAVCSGLAEWLTAFKEEGNRQICQRCGSSNVVAWPSIYAKTITCQDCQNIGPINSLQVLFRLKQPQSVMERVSEESSLLFEECQPPALNYSDGQKHAAEELWQCVLGDKEKETLLWAACGAGKTEVCFPLIRHLLHTKKKVLFAAPRLDVVHDVQPRLVKCFPDIEIKLLSGAVSHDYKPAQLTVATSYQVLRFYRAFDVVIFDEMDAYPYTGNQVLAFGLRQALKENGQMVYLTATPSKEILARFSAEKRPVVRLPIRYHGHPLPVPEWHKIELKETYRIPSQAYDKRNLEQPLKVLKETLSELTYYGPVLVFVPTIALVKMWKTLLTHLLGDLNIDGSWSSDPARVNKIMDFSRGKGDIFISTSILERGITIKGVQTVVLYADHEIFNTRTLVQMAGRTGRHDTCNFGKVLFLASRETPAMVEARQWIIEQNDLAKAWGSSHERMA